MFAIITPALITGAFADRVKFKSYLWFLVFWSVLVYIPFVHWIWGGGFLQQWGVLDFAGGMVVHVSAGFAALASVWVVGKRRFMKGERSIPHNIAFVALGTGLLWFGWFGFNGGSALAANGIAAQAFVNTDIAGSIAMCTWLFITWWRDGKPSLVGALTGAVAGLACVTPGAGYIPTWAAFFVGILAAGTCYAAVRFKRMEWDDALDVWGVHGVGGALGTILVGVFALKSVNPAGADGLLAGNAAFLGKQVRAHRGLRRYRSSRRSDPQGHQHDRSDPRAGRGRAEGPRQRAHGETAYMLDLSTTTRVPGRRPAPARQQRRGGAERERPRPSSRLKGADRTRRVSFRGSAGATAAAPPGS